MFIVGGFLDSIYSYDEDFNHEPCQRSGHRAHWAVASGRTVYCHVFFMVVVGLWLLQLIYLTVKSSTELGSLCIVKYIFESRPNSHKSRIN